MLVFFQVIELLGSEDVKLSSKEIKRVLEMFDNEQLAEIVQSQETGGLTKETAADSSRNTEEVPPGSSLPPIPSTAHVGVTSHTRNETSKSDSTAANETDTKR